MPELCSNRPEGINIVSDISSPLPTQCFFDTILMPLPTWLLITALVLLAIIFPATKQIGRRRVGNPRQWLRRATAGAYYFFAIAAVGMQLLEMGRLAAADLGVALLPFATVGTLLVVVGRVLSDRMLPLQRSAFTATSVLFWSLGTCMAGVKMVALMRFMGDSEDGRVNPLARQSSAYPVDDQISDNAVLGILYALLTVLEPAMYFVLLPVVGRGGQAGKEHSFVGTPSTPSSACSSAQPRPSINITCLLPQSHGSQEQQKPSKRSCLKPVCYDRGLVQSNDARKAVEAFSIAPLTESSTVICHGAMLQHLTYPSKPTPFDITHNLQVHDKRDLQSSSPTVNPDVASGTMKGELIHRYGDEVTDRATQGHHSHSAAVPQSSASSRHVGKSSGPDRISLEAAVKIVGINEAPPPVCVENVDMENETYHEKTAAVGVKRDGLDVSHGAPQDNSVLPSDFDLDSDMEDDMSKLVDGDSDTKPHQTPPLSVLEGMDKQSRDADEYDPRLRRSPQASRDGGSNSKHGRGDSSGQDCDMLDYEV
ncbi:hypothetical protein MCOR25_004548 [Pyricularia grisea]|nr:hypothetical protein MCOR25_004548 [Pyricularia grisea]